MEVTVAKTAGFCFGVKRAVDKVYESVGCGKKIYTLGPIIHNSEVVKDLEAHGVITLKDETMLDTVDSGGVVIIRSHGVPKRVIDLLEQKNIKYIDMTCPFVSRIHKIVSEAGDNEKIIISGSDNHPEVVGIKGWCNTAPYVAETIEDASRFETSYDTKVTMVSQTTFNYNKFQDFIEIFEKKGYDVNVVNTICDATRKRQHEAGDIASKVDTMIVIGDKSSSNSKKLYDICKEKCDNTFFIQTLSELVEGSGLMNFDKTSLGNTVGITAGASTPNNIIKEVQNYVRINF